MKQVLSYLHEHKSLSYEQAKEVLIRIGKGEVNSAHISAFISVYLMRSITLDELCGFRDALLELCVPADLKEFDPMDVCGTGGDGKDTFNISTCASFVVAASGIAVAKHGNHGVSSSVGSSTIMEYFGYKFTNDIDVLKKQLEHCNICFMHAPLFHPAMKHVAPIRKELGLKTFFNMLGPLVNPATPQTQMSGVFSLELLRLYGYLFQQSQVSYCVVYSLEGYDEVSLTSDFKLISNTKNSILSPQTLGFSTYNACDIKAGSTLEESSKIFLNVLQNQSTPAQRDVVIANAALAIWCKNQHLSYRDATDIATESLASGKAYALFKKLMELN